MAWSVPIWKIYGFPKVSFYLGRFVLKHATAHIHQRYRQGLVRYDVDWITIKPLYMSGLISCSIRSSLLKHASGAIRGCEAFRNKRRRPGNKVNSWAGWNGVVNKFELSWTCRHALIMWKLMIHIDQNGKKTGCHGVSSKHVDVDLPAYRQHLTHSVILSESSFASGQAP